MSTHLIFRIARINIWTACSGETFSRKNRIRIRRTATVKIRRRTGRGSLLATLYYKLIRVVRKGALFFFNISVDQIDMEKNRMTDTNIQIKKKKNEFFPITSNGFGRPLEKNFPTCSP